MLEGAHQIIALIKDPQRMDANMLRHMQQIVSHHPYFTLAHALVAKGTYMLGGADLNTKIGKASLYVTDRGQLKRLILGDGTIKTPAQKPTSSSSVETRGDGDDATQAAPTTPKAVKAKEQHSTMAPPKMEQVISEIHQNLAALKSSREAYLAKEDAIYSQELSDTLQKVKASLREDNAPDREAMEGMSAEEKQRIVEALERQGSRTKAAKSLGISDKLLGKKMRVHGITFARGRTQVRATDSSSAPQGDLSTPSQRLEEAIPSETLAKLYIKQGKVEKAIEVYKKMAYLCDARREDIEQKVRGLRNMDKDQ